MKNLIAILFILSCLSCNQNTMKKEPSMNEFDKQYFFGFEYQTIIDSSLIIPDSIRLYNERTQQTSVIRYNLSDSTMCFRGKKSIFIKPKPLFNLLDSDQNYFLIWIDGYSFGYKYIENVLPSCGTCLPNRTLIGKRLFLNKAKYEINDTINGKLLLKYYVDHYCSEDSSKRFKIEVDSILFKYRLHQGTTNLINQFVGNYNKDKSSH